MRSEFPLFQTPLDLAHSYWERLIQKGDTAVDATCGNGRDALVLAHLILDKSEGELYLFDIQEKALEAASQWLRKNLHEPLFPRIHLLHQCHSHFPADWQPASIALFVYNLGYLPGADHAITTRRETTLESVRKALVFVKPGGAISITCYPGHEEGAHEEKMILDWSKGLSQKEWSVCLHRWENRRQSPSLLLIQKAKN